MSNSRKTIWIIFALFMFIQLGAIYIVDKNQEDMYFLMKMKGYIHYMLYFSLASVVLFMLSFMVYQLDNIKSKKDLAQLEQDKTELKAKLFDLQEQVSKPKESTQPLPPADPDPDQESTPEESTNSESDSE